MKNLILLVLLAAVVVGGKYGYDRMNESNLRTTAETRVRSMLDGMRAGGGGEQDALCLWLTGTANCVEHEIRAGTDRFSAWRRDLGIARVGEFRIDGVATGGDLGAGAARVDASVDGRPLAFLVRAGEPVGVAAR